MNSTPLLCFYRRALKLKDTEEMRILIVEDEPRMLELLRKGLYEHGFTVMTAADGETGLEIATAHELDAIVLDIGLPKMDGYELMRALRSRAAQDAGADADRARLGRRDHSRLDLGADDYLTKPFSFPELVARLQSITRPSEECGRHHRSRRCRGRSDPAHRDPQQREHRPDATGVSAADLPGALAGQCVPRQALMECVWGANHARGASALDVLVNSLARQDRCAVSQEADRHRARLGLCLQACLSAAERTDA
jgi:DNA-binding response OmpR family regulator